MTKIFQPSIKFFYNEELPSLKEGKPIEISEEEFPWCSSKDKALEMLKENLAEIDSDQNIVSITITEKELDSTEFWELKFYDKNLNYCGKFEYEPTYPNPKYKTGDWVLFSSNGHINCGLVVADAEDEDKEPYLVIYENTQLNDCSPHVHLDEFFIINKISQDEAKKLLPRKFFEIIKLRSKNYK